MLFSAERFVNAVEEFADMQINNSYQSIANTPSEPAPVSVSASVINNVNAAVAQYASALENAAPENLPGQLMANTDIAVAARYEINQLLQQFIEWMRTATESRRMRFLYELLLKESRETSDFFGKIMDIARRVMRSEMVSLEEMRLLAEQYPQLLFVVALLKHDGSDGSDRRQKRDRRQGDRRAGARRRDDGSRNRNQYHTRAGDNAKYAMPLDLASNIHSHKIQISIKKSPE